jgi:hypothetical protein
MPKHKQADERHPNERKGMVVQWISLPNIHYTSSFIAFAVPIFIVMKSFTLFGLRAGEYSRP